MERKPGSDDEPSARVGPDRAGKEIAWEEVRAVAATSRLDFLSAKGSELLDKEVGEPERAVRKVFARARQAAPPVLFPGEVEARLPSRGSCAGRTGADPAADPARRRRPGFLNPAPDAPDGTHDHPEEQAS